ncbi:hypothetical protein IPZ61_00925 [Streptomyces sioyaensis]|uniref:hypothetical protein n=1 Tax=Streptomyces sioyaensis TaxID=67364 RepID=UPI001F37BE76|nr:hypothetical protein [Streptomyces sioyaensis]MCF3171913.1 hypothetical protein [Streptomyces sioyaensis]
MHIDWHGLVLVCVVSLVVVTLLVVVFSLGIVALARSHRLRTSTMGRASVAEPLARATAFLCFALCAALGGYGIHLIVSHSP